MSNNTPLLPLPNNAEELKRCLADPKWRIFSGCLYKIKIKGDDFRDEVWSIASSRYF